MTEHRVVFTPSGKRGDFADDVTVLAAARALGVDLDSVCGGRGICGRCQIDVAEGHFAKHGLNSAPTMPARGTRSSSATPTSAARLPLGRRLGCQAKICGDLVVDVPPESQVHRQVVRKRAEEHAIAIDPVVRLHYVEVREPDMHEPASDFRRLSEALAEQWGLAGLARRSRRAGGIAKDTARRRRGRRLSRCAKGRDIVAVYPGLLASAPSASRSTWARRLSRRISAISRPAPSSLRSAR